MILRDGKSCEAGTRDSLLYLASREPLKFICALQLQCCNKELPFVQVVSGVVNRLEPFSVVFPSFFIFYCNVPFRYMYHFKLTFHGSCLLTVAGFGGTHYNDSSF